MVVLHSCPVTTQPNHVDIVLFGPRKECLSIWSRNLMGYNEDVVSAWGVFVTSHIGYEINFLAIYNYISISFSQLSRHVLKPRGSFGPKADNIYMVGLSHYMSNLFFFPS